MSETKSKDTKVVAFIDLGSNSVRMSIVQIFANGGTNVLNHVKHMVQLGEGAFLNNILQRDAMDRTVEAVQSFSEMCKSFGVDEVLAVATSCVRDAENGKAFLDELEQKTGLSFSCISGIEEARLIYKGLSQQYEVSTTLRLFVDIGGGSTEFIVGDSYTHRELDSVKMGCVRMANMFMSNKHDAVLEKDYKQMQSYVRSTGSHAFGRMSSYVIKELVVSSGTIRNLAEIAACLEIDDEKLIKENYLSYKTLCKIVRLLCSKPEEERKKVMGLNPKRVNVIIPGAAILQTIMEELGFEGCYVSSLGLREGLLRDYLEHNYPHVKTQDSAVQENSVFKFVKSCKYEEQHAKHVAVTAMRLFDSAKQIGVHSLCENDRRFIYYAGILHDIGIFLSFSGHDEHGYYMVKNHALLGFTEDQQEEIACLVASHRMKENKVILQAKNINDTPKKELEVMALFLKLAESLDRTHNQIVEEIAFTKESSGVYLDIVISDPSPVEQDKIEDGRSFIQAIIPDFVDFRWQCKN